MSERLGMADGRCFTINTASTLFNDHLMKTNGIQFQDNYSFRKLLQSQGPALLDDYVSKEKCPKCNRALLQVRNTY